MPTAKNIRQEAVFDECAARYISRARCRAFEVIVRGRVPLALSYVLTALQGEHYG